MLEEHGKITENRQGESGGFSVKFPSFSGDKLTDRPKTEGTWQKDGKKPESSAASIQKT
jgi:hypothetical protein